MNCERPTYPIKTGKINRYKYISTSGHDSGVTIFIKKRLFGFLWWVFVKDRNNCPITYNHFYAAEAFMQGRIKYYDMLHQICDWSDGGYPAKITVVPMTDELACEKINDYVERSMGERAELACVQKAWELDRKRYCHVAADYAILWHQIYKELGKKSWEK